MRVSQARRSGRNQKVPFDASVLEISSYSKGWSIFEINPKSQGAAAPSLAARVLNGIAPHMQRAHGRIDEMVERVGETHVARLLLESIKCLEELAPRTAARAAHC